MSWQRSIGPETGKVNAPLQEAKTLPVSLVEAGHWASQHDILTLANNVIQFFV